MSQANRILVVEDDDSIRELVHMTLADEGYEVMTAAHGAAALEIIGNSQPDFIILDMCMPVMDGWEFSRLYHQMPGPHAPIVVLSAAHSISSPALDVEASAYLTKPFDLEDLLDLVGRHGLSKLALA